MPRLSTGSPTATSSPSQLATPSPPPFPDQPTNGDKNSTSTARCRVCNDKIQFTVGNPVELGFHMIDRHGTGSVVQFSIHEDEQICPTRKPNGPPCYGTCRRMHDHNVTWRPQNLRKGSMNVKYNRGRQRGLYKTTLETWTPGAIYMICPTCDKEVKPLIRSQKNKVAYTSLGATFLLSCWPFCFLFPLLHRCAVDLYCPKCKNKLGIYDTSTGVYEPGKNVIISNKEVVPNIKT